jgi:hypothetical protein
VRYTVTFREADYARLIGHLFADRTVERAAHLLCGISESAVETRLLVRDVIPTAAEDVIEASGTHMRIASRSFIRVLKRADRERCAFVFVHSHPGGYERHSPQDDVEERKLFGTAHVRVSNVGVHASLVLSDPGRPNGRVWLADGTVRAVDRVRVIGDRFRFCDDVESLPPTPEFFDRQVRAFGKDIQALLGRLTIGVVGGGGTGSAITEQLLRLGVGTLVVADGQRFERSNVNRVYGSRVSDDGTPKVDLLARLADGVGLGTKFISVDRPITFRSALETFKQCDLIFGCTDEEWGRSLLTRFALYYLTPVIDMGVRIDSEDGQIHSVQGRLTTLMPGAACLFCRGRLTSRRVALESLRVLAPDEAERLRAEGYVPELDDPSPAVITFTSSVAAGAVNELLHRLTGYMGAERRSTEVLYYFDGGRVATNTRMPAEDCLCSDTRRWGRGDRSPFLDVTWRPDE